MKIKKNEYVSGLDIDKVLTEKHDLGFLLDQITNNRFRDVYFLSVIDILRFIPQFNEAIKQIREDLQIDPQAIRDKLSILIGKSKFQNYLTELKQIARGIDFPLNEGSKGIIDQIKDWKRKEFPSLLQRVTGVRIKVLGKTPHSWQESIEDFILFEKISSMPIIYRRPDPEINVKIDDKTREHYIEIKIYSDTDMRYLPKTNKWKNIQKALPAYYNPTEGDESLTISRFMQYVLRRHLKLTQKQALEWIKKHKLTVPDYQHASQEIKRFENLFMSTNRK